MGADSRGNESSLLFAQAQKDLEAPKVVIEVVEPPKRRLQSFLERGGARSADSRKVRRIPVGHFVREQPVFDGFPAGGLMGQSYRNVAANNSIGKLPDDAIEIGGCLSWDVNRDYRGPTEWWHGTDRVAEEYGYDLFHRCSASCDDEVERLA